MQKLFSALNYAAISSGDLWLGEYACMVNISEFENGLTLRELKHVLSGCANPAVLVNSLEEKELIERIRSSQDRRTFSLVITAKGRSRIDMMDQALSLALIHASDKLTEASFTHFQEQLQSLVFKNEDERRIATLLPAEALTFLCSYHSTVVKKCSLFGLSSIQTATLILTGEAETGVSAERISRLLQVPLETLQLHLEKLSARGLIHEATSEGDFILLDEGRRRVESFLSRFESTGAVSTALRQLSAEQLTALEDLFELLLYLFTPQTNAGTSKGKKTSLLISTSNRIAALSLLFAQLAQLFSYPDRKSPSERFSTELIDTCSGLLDAAGITAQIPDTVCADFASWTARPEKVRMVELRAEFTRLFYTMPRLVSLNGADWVHTGLTDFARKHGERAAVGLEYRNLNLKNRKGLNEPFDNIVSELDFLSYITSFEAGAFEAGDALNAREWEHLRMDFMEHHLSELSRGVSQGIRNTSEHAYLLFCAAFLDIVVDYA